MDWDILICGLGYFDLCGLGYLDLSIYRSCHWVGCPMSPDQWTDECMGAALISGSVFPDQWIG